MEKDLNIKKQAKETASHSQKTSSFYAPCHHITKKSKVGYF